MSTARLSIVILLLAGLLTACFGEPEKKLERRIKAFTVLLTPAELALFESEAYQELEEVFVPRLSADEDLRQAFSELRSSENIEFLSLIDVFKFYGRSLMATTRLYRFVDLLESDELLAFNAKRHSELAQLLAKRFLANPDVWQTYRDQIQPQLSELDANQARIEYAFETLFLPFIELYPALKPEELGLLSEAKLELLVQQLVARVPSSPELARAITMIKSRHPGARKFESPRQVFALVLESFKTREACQALLRLSEWWTGQGSPSFAKLESALDLEFLKSSLGAVNEADLLTGRLSRDIAWFELVVEEKIDFFN